MAETEDLKVDSPHVDSPVDSSIVHQTPSTPETDNPIETDTTEFDPTEKNIADSTFYEVDKITRVRSTRDDNCDEYYVSYKGFPKSYNQWVKATDMTPELLFRAVNLKLPRAKPRVSLVKTEH